MKNSNASTSKIDEEDLLPGLEGVQDTKSNSWLNPAKKRISLLKGLRDQLESAPSNLEDRRVISRPHPTLKNIRKQYELFKNDSASTASSLALEPSKLHEHQMLKLITHDLDALALASKRKSLELYSSQDCGSLWQAIPEKHLRIAPFK